MEKETVTIHINGCTVTCPAEEEQLYREALADKWIDGYRVYVKDNNVHIDMRTDKDGMDLETMRDLLIEQNNKIFALAGRYTCNYNIEDSLFAYDEERKVVHSEEDKTPIPVFEALILLCSPGKWKNPYNKDILHKMFPSLTPFQFTIIVVLFTNECEDNKYWEYREFLEEFGALSDEEIARDIEDLKEREILLSKFGEGPESSVEYLRLNSHYELHIQKAGIHRIIKGDSPFGQIEERFMKEDKNQ